MLRRLLGLIIICTSIAGIGVGIGGIFVGQWVLDSADVSARAFADDVGGAVDSAESTLITLRDTLSETHTTLVTVEQSTLNMAFAITSTEPALNNVAVVVGETVPETIETIQLALPNVITVAATVDDALQTLSNLNLSRTLFGNTIALPSIDVGFTTISLPNITIPSYDLNFDLGIAYNPEMAFDQSLVGIGQNLEGIPDEMRTLRDELDETTVNIIAVGDDVHEISSNISAMNTELGLLPHQIDLYLASLNEIHVAAEDAASKVETQTTRLRFGVTLFFIWVALTHLAPLAVGWGLLFGRKNTPGTA